MSKVAIKGADTGTGVFTLESPATNTDRTLTIPDVDGSIVTADASGNVGLGTSSPTQKLHISNNGNAYQLIDSSGIANGYNAATLYKNSERQYRVGTLGTVGGFAGGALIVYDETAAAWRMVIDASGNVGIGTNSPSTFPAKLAVSGYIASGGQNYSAGFSDAVYSTFRIGHQSGLTNLITDAAMAFYTSSVERARIDSSGNFQIGGSGNPARLNVVHAATYGVFIAGAAGSSTPIIFFSGATNTGSISTNGTSTSFNTSSDYRLKEDWVAVANASTRINALKPVNFAWKASNERVDGFLAHELAEVVPEAVTGEKDAVELVDIKDEDGNVTNQEERPVYQGIDQSKLVPLLTAALQEALARIETLEADVATLKGTP